MARQTPARAGTHTRPSPAELERLRELTARTVADEGGIGYSCGTMIELPRACVPFRIPVARLVAAQAALAEAGVGNDSEAGG